MPIMPGMAGKLPIEQAHPYLDSYLRQYPETPTAVLPQSSAGQVLKKCGYYAGILFPKIRVICGLEI